MPRPADTPFGRSTKDWNKGFGRKPIRRRRPTAEQLLGVEAEAARLVQVRLRGEFLRREQERHAA